jgi:hypothetical protein
MRVLIPQHGHVEAPLAVDKRFQQELNHAFFIKMLAHDGAACWRVVAPASVTALMAAKISS